MMYVNPCLLKDFYKVGHVDQYPKGTELVFSNFTPRKSRMPGVNHSVFFGLRYFINEYLIEQFKKFFNGLGHLNYHYVIKETLGISRMHTHIYELHHQGFLPLAIYALPEGAVVPSGVPALVMFNTKPEFYWLTNMLETILSCTLWGPCTSATIAREYRLLLDKYAIETSSCPEFVDYQAHDFSFRGMYGLEAAMMSGAAHLEYFKGTDTIPAILFRHRYYDNQLSCGTSVPATEHSVMSAGGKEDEHETYRRLIEDIYPSGIVSIVSDTWDLWHVVDNILPFLKDKIMSRNGKVVIRPDSGDPVKIICGDYSIPDPDTSESKGLIKCLWEIFGGTINNKGYKELDPHIGAIYGDSITLERCEAICEGLKQKGFASTNIIFGIGSYTYQYNTRDTLGWAVKATYCEINGVGRAITKDPKTDDGTKKSHSGLLKVIKDNNGNYQCLQNQTWKQFHQDDNELKLVFKDGKGASD
jgi:nicotinamide phosphoribosyltransferase